MDKEFRIPIWFFIGALLGIYGLLILCSGLYGLVHPPERQVALSYLHADIWWGVLLLVIGIVYVRKFRPNR
ncbi:MAG TPA: hypothetical protein VE398_04430 [Acidobacteriota bacterium]|nr:hypothetical protein [Acidobacteriota bacterium]